MVGWHHRLDDHEFEQAPGFGDGEGSLVCYIPWSCKELDMTEKLNYIITGDWNEKVRSVEILGITGNFDLGERNEAGKKD